MPRRSRISNPIGRTRVEYDIATTNSFTAVITAPNGTPLYVRGESSQKDTYDFVVSLQKYVSGAFIATRLIRFVGMPNGQRVNIHQWYPELIDNNQATAGYTLTITPATGVSFRYYYIEQ